MRSLDVLAAAFLVAATGTARADAEDDLQRAASWCATAARIVRGVQQHALPLPYARRTLKIAVDELQDLDRALADRHDDSRGRLDRAVDAVRRARDTVEQHDAAAMRSRVDELDRQAESLARKR